VFSPDEEIQKLWSVPKEQRKEAVSIFKDKLMRQREAWALCRTSIEDRIESNPDIPRIEMVGIIGQFASIYGFAESHIEIAEQLVDDYITQHKRVVEIRKKYSDDIDLINRLTGLKFTNADARDFSIAVGPMSIDISCFEFNARRIFKGSKNSILRVRLGGFASQSRDRQPIYYTVISADVPDRDSTIIHEHEHQKNRLLRPKLYFQEEIRADARQKLNQSVAGFLRHQFFKRVLSFERNFEKELLYRYEFSKDPQQKAFFLKEYMRLTRGSALNFAKNEILAMKKDRSSDSYDRFFEDNSSYDYLALSRKPEGKRDDQLETAQRILVDEYRMIIESAVSWFDELVNSGYSIEEAIALLSDKSLPDWPKTVRRLLETKQSQN
jgi:hypothetical protein